MTDANPLFLKLYYSYIIQKRGLEHLVQKLKEGGHDGLLQFNTAFVGSLMTEQQRESWPLWVKEITSPVLASHMDQLERSYGILTDLPHSTHLHEYVPETKTVLVVEN